jgi:plasmid stabilization system protein ParE
MAANLIVTPDAEQDLDEAADWYERDRPGRGARFLTRVAETVTAIRRSPRAFSPYRVIYRRTVVKHFPYVVIYGYDDSTDTVTVYAVFHTSQDPSKLDDRLP